MLSKLKYLYSYWAALGNPNIGGFSNELSCQMVKKTTKSFQVMETSCNISWFCSLKSGLKNSIMHVLQNREMKLEFSLQKQTESKFVYGKPF